MDMIRITSNYGYGYRLLTGAAPPSGDVTSNPQTCGFGHFLMGITTGHTHIQRTPFKMIVECD